MRVKFRSGNFVLVAGDSGEDYWVDLARGSCPCKWGTYRLSHKEKKQCKHFELAKKVSVLDL